MASEIRVDKINSLSGVGTVTLSPTGVDIAGITTAATLRATTGIVTSLTAGSLTSLGAVSGTTGTFSAAVSGTTGTFTGNVAVSGANITVQDSGGTSDDRITLGAGPDMQLYHDGTNSVLTNATGDLYINNNGGASDDIIIKANDDIYLQPQDGESGVSIIGDGAVELYHNNAKKLETTSNGVKTSGRAEIDGNCFPYSDDNSDLGLSANRWQDLYLSGNIYLGGTGSANALDDYEEGTWTPTVYSGIDGGAGYSIQRGWYTKIGQFVQVSFFMRLVNSATGGTGNGNQLQIAGLPFQAANLSPAYSSGGHSQYTNMSGSGSSQVSFYIEGGYSILYCYRDRDGAFALSGNNANKEMYGVATYRVI